MAATFGPAGNSQSFFDEGRKHTFEAPEWVASKGLDAYEFQGGHGIVGSEATWEKIGKEAEKHNIKMSVHAPYYISLSSVEEEKRANSVSYITKSIKCAEILGADTIVIHTGSASKISRETAVEYAKGTMAAAIEANPDTKVRFGLETMGKLNQLGTLEEVIDICKIDKRLCPVVDFGHLNARNIGGLFVCEDDYKRVFDAIGNALGDEKARYLHCHFSKIEFTGSGEKKHLTFADTVYGPDFEPLMEVVIKNGLSPRIICESDGTMAEDALAMKKYYISNGGK